MKVFKTFNDLQYIISNRLDMVDRDGYKLDFVVLLRCTLNDLLQMMVEGKYSFPIEH